MGKMLTLLVQKSIFILQVILLKLYTTHQMHWLTVTSFQRYRFPVS